MKEFSCGDVVPGCTAHFSAATDDEILSAVAEHARRDHGMTEVTAALVDAVRASIQTAA